MDRDFESPFYEEDFSDFEDVTGNDESMYSSSAQDNQEFGYHQEGEDEKEDSSAIRESSDFDPFLDDESYNEHQILEHDADANKQFSDQIGLLQSYGVVGEESFVPPLPFSFSKRGIKMELQMRHIKIYRVSRSGRRSVLPRKYGPLDKPYLYKGKRGRKAKKGKEGTAIELQSEARGWLEFETPKWFNSWCALKKRIEEAVAITKEIENSSNLLRDNGRVRTYKFPFDDRHLRRRKAKFRGKQTRLARGEKLEVDILYKHPNGSPLPKWAAGIQVSESMEITKFGAYMKQHITAADAVRITTAANGVLRQANPVGKLDDTPRLLNLLQIIQNYLWSINTESDKTRTRRQNAGRKLKKKELPLAKQHIYLMSRTNLASIYKELLWPEEKRLFDKIVKDELILKKNGLSKQSKMFPEGYNGRSLGRVRPTVGRFTVHKWLRSIHTPRKGGRRKGDLLSLIGGDNRAMGRWLVPTGLVKDRYMVRFEARVVWGSGLDSIVQPASNWVAFSKRAFAKAAQRNGSWNFLKYNPKECP